MEAEITGDRRRRRMFVIVGVVLAIAAGSASFYLSTRVSTGPAATPQTREIVVAAVDIHARTQILAAMVTTVTVPDSTVLSGVSRDPKAVLGTLSIVDISKGEPIYANMYGSANPSGLQILNPGETVAPDSPLWRAVSVMVPKERAVGGIIAAGDHVDLFATLSIATYDQSGTLSNGAMPSLGYYSAQTTKLTWTDVEVLNANIPDSLYVVKVDEHEAEEIAHIQGSGANSFSMSLRPAADARDVDRSGYGETTNRIIEQYDFPVPQVIDLNGYPQPSPQPSPFSNLPWGATPSPSPLTTPAPSPTSAPSLAPAPSPSPAPTASASPVPSPSPSSSPLPKRTRKP